MIQEIITYSIIVLAIGIVLINIYYFLIKRSKKNDCNSCDISSDCNTCPYKDLKSIEKK